MVEIEVDKLKHYVVGTLIAAGSMWLLGWFAIVLVIVVAIGKELWDAKHKGHVADWRDAAATVLGGIVVVLGNLLTQW